MKCQDIKFDLPLYFDDVLSEDDRIRIDLHLAACPICRIKLSDLQNIRGDLVKMARPVLSEGFLTSIRNAVQGSLAPHGVSPSFVLIEDRRDWIETWTMPTLVGAFASLLFGLTLVWQVMPPGERTETASLGRSYPSAVMVAGPQETYSNGIEISPVEYANSRLAFSSESPSVNPRGALLALTRSLLRGRMKDEEVVIVADVFGNGLARIAEIVEPADDREIAGELRRAMQSDIEFAPFLPASLDHRSESVRVILKFQSVNVVVAP
jgi:hypothetical protein